MKRLQRGLSTPSKNLRPLRWQLNCTGAKFVKKNQEKEKSYDPFWKRWRKKRMAAKLLVAFSDSIFRSYFNVRMSSFSSVLATVFYRLLLVILELSCFLYSDRYRDFFLFILFLFFFIEKCSNVPLLSSN